MLEHSFKIQVQKKDQGEDWGMFEHAYPSTHIL